MHLYFGSYLDKMNVPNHAGIMNMDDMLNVLISTGEMHHLYILVPVSLVTVLSIGDAPDNFLEGNISPIFLSQKNFINQ